MESITIRINTGWLDRLIRRLTERRIAKRRRRAQRNAEYLEFRARDYLAWAREARKEAKLWRLIAVGAKMEDE